MGPRMKSLLGQGSDRRSREGAYRFYKGCLVITERDGCIERQITEIFDGEMGTNAGDEWLAKQSQ